MLLTVENLTKRYLHTDGPVNALDGVSLDVDRGAFMTVTGSSGAGKSTLLLTLGGLMRATSGRMHFEDQPLHEATDGQLARFRRDHVGFVMQSFSLVPYLSAIRNVMVPLSLRGAARDVQRERAAALLDEVGLGGRINHLPRELSAGQQQRVAIARAMANEPALILADEPTGNLDPGLARDILGVLGRLSEEQGIAVVMVTHSPEAAACGNVRVHLEDGRVVDPG